MAKPAHLQWGAEALWQALAPWLPGLAVDVVDSVDSTNTRLIERARVAAGDPVAPITRPGQLEPPPTDRPVPRGRRAGDLAPSLLVAEQQTRGRGRLGRAWASSPVDSLTFSLALPLAPADWSGLSLAVGLALAEALDPATPDAAPRIGLKWPNDLWLVEARGRGRKLGGILIETVSIGAHRLCVIGIGLNVRPVVVDGLATACLQELRPGVMPPEVLATLAVPLARALRAFERQGFAAGVPAYAARDVLRGQPVVATSSGAAGEAEDGIAEGVDERGALRLRLTDGGVRCIVSGEVSVRLRPSPGGP